MPILKDGEVFKLLWRVLPNGHTALSFDQIRRMIGACQAGFSKLQNSEFTRTQALMTVATIVDLSKVRIFSKYDTCMPDL